MQRYGKRLVCCSIAFCIGDILHIERRTIEHKFLISMFALAYRPPQSVWKPPQRRHQDLSTLSQNLTVLLYANRPKVEAGFLLPKQ